MPEEVLKPLAVKSKLSPTDSELSGNLLKSGKCNSLHDPAFPDPSRMILRQSQPLDPSDVESDANMGCRNWCGECARNVL